MYADDYDGQMPSSYMVSRSKRWNARDSRRFVSKLGVYPSQTGRKQTIWQILYDNMKNKDIPFCRSDPAYEQHNADGLRKASTQTSYWYRLANDKAWYGVGCEKPRRSIADYAFSADQIAFYEHMGWHFGDNKGLHKGALTNASFMDTHVETILIPDNATSGDPINCAVNSDGEPMYYNCRAVGKHGYPRTQTGPATLTDPAKCYDKL